MKPLDVFVLFVFLRKLVKPFHQWDAYKVGLIDDTGHIIVPKKDRTPEQENSMSYLDRLVRNLKRMIALVPGGSSIIASYAAALMLVREGTELQNRMITEDLDDIDLDLSAYMAEATMLSEEVASTNMGSGNIANKGGELMQDGKKPLRRKLPRFKQVNESLAKPEMLKRLRDMHVDPMTMEFTVRDKERAIVSLKDVFSDAGWSHMGTGVGGTVFSHPSKSYVLKIFSTADQGYSLWLSFCMANQSNPYVPKIYGRPIPINQNIAAVRIEKLSKASGHDMTHINEIEYWFYRGTTTAFPGDESMRKAAAKVFAFLNNASAALDLHSQNIMKRGNQIVIIDPLNQLPGGNLESVRSKYSKSIEKVLASRFDPHSAINVGALIH